MKERERWREGSNSRGVRDEGRETGREGRNEEKTR